MTCNKRLAPGQWWNFCGESDMGQTKPVKCTNCGGSYILEEDVSKRLRKEKYLNEPNKWYPSEEGS